MVPVIGSGKFVTSPIISDDGQPIEDATKGNMRDNEVMSTSSRDLEEKVIQWKLVLHQIGMYLLYCFIIHLLLDPSTSGTQDLPEHHLNYSFLLLAFNETWQQKSFDLQFASNQNGCTTLIYMTLL